MKRTLIFGGAGFVGMNIAERLLGQGKPVCIFDRSGLPEAAEAVFERLPGHLDMIRGDVTNAEAVRTAIDDGVDAIVLGAAITAGPAREAVDADLILRVNLLSHVAILEAARDHGVRRIVNLSSAAVFGARSSASTELDEDDHPQPRNLYGITKLASESMDRRLASLWGLDLISLRLSAVFGPWERATGVRDTLSPQCQILSTFETHGPALLARPGLRDWIYAVDVAEAVERAIEATRVPSPLYHLSAGQSWTALDWGRALATRRLSSGTAGLVCRLARPDETATIDLHAATDRSPMRVDRLARDLGWQARFGLKASLDHLELWRDTIGALRLSKTD